MIGKEGSNGDCLGVVTEINQGSNADRQCMIFKDIEGRQKYFLVSIFRHEEREKIREAHRIAKMATSLEAASHVWFSSPHEHLSIPVNTCDQ